MKIDYEKINDPDYFSGVIQSINNVTEPRILYGLLNMLSEHLRNKEVATPIEASMIKSAIQNRLNTLSLSPKKDAEIDSAELAKFEEYADKLDSITDAEEPITNKKNNRGDKVLKLHPTSVTSKAGTVSVVLIFAGIAITSIMYTLLWIAHTKG